MDEKFREKNNEIDQLKQNCESLAKQVGRELLLERKIEIQNNLIDKLKDDEKRAEKKIRNDNIEDIENLMFEISQLQGENKQKETLLKKVKDENAMINENLQILEVARKDLVENNQKIDEANLSDELDDQMTKHFKCNHCAKEFETRSCLRDHRKVNHEDKFTSRSLLDNLNKMESKVSHQKYNLLSCLLDLEKEDTKKQPWNCFGDCKINHSICN